MVHLACSKKRPNQSGHKREEKRNTWTIYTTEASVPERQPELGHANSIAVGSRRTGEEPVNVLDRQRLYREITFALRVRGLRSIVRFFRSAAKPDAILNLLCQSQLALEGEHESDDASGDSHVQSEDFHPMEHVPERCNFGSCTVDARERILTSHELAHNTSCAYGLRYIGNSGGYARMIRRNNMPDRAPSRIDWPEGHSDDQRWA
ncbi:hypothetical protein U1Q18_007656 [Sarracenia purpurea var. burkii]